MPQLDPANYSTQLFWLTVSFVILYVVLARFLLPRIQSVFDLRSRTVESDLTHAENLQTEAKRAQELYEKGLAETRTKSDAVISNAKDKVADTAAGRLAELEEILEKKLAESEESIVRAKKEVMGKLKPVASELAEKIVEVVLNHKPDSKAVESAVNGFVKENAA